MDYYNGPWNDRDNRWTTKTKSQVPYVNNQNDGVIFIDADDFKTAFLYFQINHDHDLDGWKFSYYEVINDSAGTQRSFTFKTTSAQELFVAADFYDYRMYPPTCKGYYTTGTL